MNKNTRTFQTPPRGLLGRFMRRVSVANFVYQKEDGNASYRSVIVLPNESMGNYLKGFDLTRNGFRTFKRRSIVSDVQIQTKHLDTVSLLVR